MQKKLTNFFRSQFFQKLSFDNFSIRFYLPSMKPTLMWWGDSSNYEVSSRVSTRRARRSDAATFNKNWHSVNHLHGKAKDLQRYCFKIRISSPYNIFEIWKGKNFDWSSLALFCLFSLLAGFGIWFKVKEFTLEQSSYLQFIFPTCRFGVRSTCNLINLFSYQCAMSYTKYFLLSILKEPEFRLWR